MDMRFLKPLMQGACAGLVICCVIYTMGDVVVWIASHTLRVCLK